MGQRVRDWFVRHWFFAGCITVIFVSIPEWINSVWGLFSPEPIFQVIARRVGGINMPTFSPYWLTIPVSLLMFFYLVNLKLSERRSALQSRDPSTQQHDETELARFHNRRTVPLRIEFSEDGSCRQVGPTEGHGIAKGNGRNIKWPLKTIQTMKSRMYKYG